MDRIIRPTVPKTCGSCEFGVTIKEDLKITECHGAPPTPAIMGMGPSGPAVGLLRARLPRTEKGCALWAQKQNVAAEDIIEGTHAVLAR